MNLSSIIMAAGLGTRMRSETPKHLHPLLGRPLVDWAIGAAVDAGADPVVIVVSPGLAVGPDGAEIVVQEEPKGTGDAAACARTALDGFDGDVLVLPGDAPLLDGETLDRKSVV